MAEIFRNLEKIEFVLTDACLGRCRHCSQGAHFPCSEKIPCEIVSKVIKKVTSAYSIKTVMTFGGEPLLHPEAVFCAASTAKACGVPKRQVITSGYFTADEGKMEETARRLSESGVNDLLLSVDAFHQEFIPLEVPVFFSRALKKYGVPVRTQPAWLVGRDKINPYNEKTRSILDRFSELDIEEGQGNVIFYEGRAKENLSEYFEKNIPVNPYLEDPFDIHCLSFDPNGAVLNGNVKEKDILEILREYEKTVESI